nr:MAG TPA: hypothetical protein [Caudoviricetes sp.]
MAYQVGRSRKIRESLELVDDNGNVVTTVYTDIDADKIAKEFNKRVNAIIRAEIAAKSLPKSGEITAMTTEQAEAANAAVQSYGEAVINLFQLIFGDEGTQTILDFYDNAYFEMSMQVFPFILDVVKPRIEDSVRKMQERAKQNYVTSRKMIRFGK